MTDGTIIFVHGTGVRLDGYTADFAHACQRATAAGIKARLVACAWGDPLGVTFEGLSLPDRPDAKAYAAEAEDLAHWSWLFADPLSELDQLTIPDRRARRPLPVPPGHPPAWQAEWDAITIYKPSSELTLLLERGGLDKLWPTAWTEIVVNAAIPRRAFQHSEHEIPVVAKSLARALVAQLHTLATEAGQAGPPRALRDALVMRLLSDWNQHVLGPTTFLIDALKRRVTRHLRRERHDLTRLAAYPVGDILLYQSRGAEVRAFIRDKIAVASGDGPVTLVAHSLGGIACVDLLALPNPPTVSRLVTVGSQAPLLYELGALSSLRPPGQLPDHFPPWLNIYDRNDLLSYVASRLFPGATDVETDSGQPFPDAHSAYFGNDAVWAAIRDAMP